MFKVTPICQSEVADMLREGPEYFKREITKLYTFFSEEVSKEIVDINLEHYPDYIVVTFLSYKVV